MLGTSDELPEEDSDADGISDMLGTSVSIGQHAFSHMEADVDWQRRSRSREDQLSIAAEQHRLQ